MFLSGCCQDSFLVFSFQKFELMWISLDLSYLEFTELFKYVDQWLSPNLRSFQTFFFKLSFGSKLFFFFLSTFGNLIVQILTFSFCPTVSQLNSSVLFFPSLSLSLSLFLCCSDWVNSIDIYSSSLIPFSVIFILLLSRYSEFSLNFYYIFWFIISS